MNHPDTVRRSTSFIREKLGKLQAGSLGLILGSGLSPAAEAITDAADVPYAAIPGMPRSSVAGHAGFLRSGSLAGRPVLTLCGRVHLYEGFSAAEVALPVRILAELGVRTLIITNAAGALNPGFEAGRLMLITDHINMTGQNPLTGPNEDAWGTRFPDLSEAWSPDLLALTRHAAERIDLVVERGVYVQVPGPSLETPAETRAYRRLGADAIGMSTVVEAIAARHIGLDILGISCLTNKNDPDDMDEISHEAVLAAAGRSAEGLARLLAEVAVGLPLDSSPVQP